MKRSKRDWRSRRSLVALSIVAAYALVARPAHALTLLYSASANGILRACYCPNAPWGGLAKRAWLIDRLRDDIGATNVIVLDAGDLFPPAEDAERMPAMLRAYGAMPLDAVAVGEQELELWANIPPSARRASWFGDEYFAPIPWTSSLAPLTDPAHRSAVPPWRIIHRGGYRIGIVSVIDASVFEWAPQRRAGLMAPDPIDVLTAFHLAHGNDVDVIIVLSHLGLDADRALAKRIGGAEREGPNSRLRRDSVRSDDPGGAASGPPLSWSGRDKSAPPDSDSRGPWIDVIVGGHTQSLLDPAEVVNGVVLCHPGKNAENIGILQLAPRGDADVATPNADLRPFIAAQRVTDRWTAVHRVVPLDERVDEDPAVARIVDNEYAARDSRIRKRLRNPDPLTNDAPRLVIRHPIVRVAMNPGDIRQLPVRIENRGSAPLTIQNVRSKSQWLSVVDAPTNIPPGAGADILFRLKASRMDRFFRCEYSISTDDPTRRVVQGAFKGRVHGELPWIDASVWALDPGAGRRPPLRFTDSDPPPEGPASPRPITTSPVTSRGEPKAAPPATGSDSHTGGADLSRPNHEPVLLEFFYSAGCEDCDIVKSEILPNIASAFGDRIEIRTYDIDIPENYRHRAELESATGGPGTGKVSIFIDGKEALHGLHAIRAGLTDVLLKSTRP